MRILLLFLLFSSAVRAELTLEEKIASCLIVALYPNEECEKIEKYDGGQLEDVIQLIKKHHIGGVLLKHDWHYDEEKRIIELLKKTASYPLIICQDVECGLGMRVKEIPRFPDAIELGQITDDFTLYQVGVEIGKQCASIGINLALAPVLDVNRYSESAITSRRSYSSDPHAVSRAGALIMSGIQSSLVLACGKHFPGHGATVQNSHDELPVVNLSLEELRACDLLPFRVAIENGISCIMTAHLLVPAIDSCPSSLSKTTINTYLRKELKFYGVVISDDLLMEAVRSPTATCEAFIAGNDLVLSSPNPVESIQLIKEKIVSGEVPLVELDKKLERINKNFRFHQEE